MNAEPLEQGPRLGLLQTIAFLPAITSLLLALGYPTLVSNPRMSRFAQEREIDFDYNGIFVELYDGSLYPDFPVPLVIHADGTISIAGVLIETASSHDLPALRRFLAVEYPQLIRGIAQDPSGAVLIQPHPDVTYQRLIDVLSAVLGTGNSYTFG